MNRSRCLLLPFFWGLLASCLAISGCSRSPSSPLERGEAHFLAGEYNEAIQLADAELARTTDPQLKSQFWSLKGRCLWGQSGDVDATKAQQLWEQTVAAMTESIQLQDNAEARHIRSFAYEKLGKLDLAAVDNGMWRELDPEVRKEYVLKPELSRYAPPPTSVATFGDEAENSADPGESEPAWSPRRESDESSATELAPEGDPNLAAEKEKERQRRMLPRPLVTTRGGEGDATEDPAGGDEEEETTGEVPLTPNAPDAPEEDAPRPSPARRLPGSTWQPLAGETGDLSSPNWENSLGGGRPGVPSLGAPLPGPAPTGIGVNPPLATGPTSSDFGPAPTGITGPRPSTGVFSGPATGYSAPSTGLTGLAGGQNAGRVPTGPSGMPSGFQPYVSSSGAPAVPYTGALPPDQRPTDPRSTGFFSQGPSYSPLRASPLTNPGMVAPRLPTPDFMRSPYLNPSGGTLNNPVAPKPRPGVTTRPFPAR